MHRHQGFTRLPELTVDDLAEHRATPSASAAASMSPREPELISTRRAAGPVYKPERFRSYVKRQAPIIRHRRPRRTKGRAQPVPLMRRIWAAALALVAKVGGIVGRFA